MILMCMIVSSKLVTSAPAEFETKSNVGELFPYYINDGTENNPHYVYITDEHALYNGKKLINLKILIRNLSENLKYKSFTLKTISLSRSVR